MREPLTWIHKTAYGAGAAGWALGDRLIITFALYFYCPPSDGGLIYKLPIWVIPVWGLVSIAGRVIDGFADPLVASWTDKSTHPFGRRRIWMLAGVLPLALGTIAVFFPPFDGPSWGNAAWAWFALTWYFCAFSLYACPYQALLPDLARSDRERLDLATVQAIAMLIGAGIVMVGGFGFLGVLERGGMNAEARFRVMAVVFGVVQLVLICVPIALIPEPRLVEKSTPSHLPVVQSVIATLRAPGMGLYLVGTIAFWFGFNTVASGVPYFTTVLMKRDEAFGGVVLMSTFIVAGLCFPVVNWLSKKYTKRKVMIAGAGALALVMVLVPLIRDATTGVAILALGGFPVAVLMIVPNAILSELAVHDARTRGANREAMFFGSQAFFLKVNLGVSAAVLAGLLQLGNSAANPLGVQLSGPSTAIVLLLTVFCFWKFREPSDARP